MEGLGLGVGVGLANPNPNPKPNPNLQWNNIADRGAAALARAVSSGALSKLQYLYLDNNQIGDDVRTRRLAPPSLAPPCQRHGRARRR